MSYRIGLDIGITSIGWATIKTNEGEMTRIGEMGVRIFDKPENPKDGASLALPRRQARSMRRRLRRHKHRIERIKMLFENTGIMTKVQIDKMYNDFKIQPNVYRLRYEALDRLLAVDEFVRVLIHISQRRGFKSNRKAETSNEKSDTGKLLHAVEHNLHLMEEKGYRTVGEMFYLDFDFQKNKRNKADDYRHTISRQLLQNEISQIFKVQREYGNKYADEMIENEYSSIFASQRCFDQGPGGNSPYGGNQIEKMLGICTFEPEERRAVKASYTFERFMLINKVNTLRIRKTGEGYRQLSMDEKRKIINEAYNTNEIKYSKLRNLLSLASDESFKGLTYGMKSQHDIEKTNFVRLHAYHEIRKAVDLWEIGYIKKLSTEQLNEVGYALTVFKNDIQITEHLIHAGIQPKAIEQLLKLSFDKTGHLSIKAMTKILPYIEQGMDYDKACIEAGYDFRAHSSNIKSIKLPPLDFEHITNPVVKRALSQSIKVINAIVHQYGSPDGINIELAREMSKNFIERGEVQKSMEQNQAVNEKLCERLIHEFGLLSPKGEDIVKLKLYEEQDGWCLYSCKKLDLKRVFYEPGYADIDHIIPYSICFDDSYKNKVLVSGNENRQKGNQLPLEYLHDTPERLDQYLSLIDTMKLPYLKKQNLLKKNISKDEEEEFKDRNLNDTRYITKELANHIRDNLHFAETSDNRAKRVISVNGQVTAYMRRRWGLTKMREEGDLHHTLDAVVIACINDSIIQRVSNYHKHKESLFMGRPTWTDKSSGQIMTRNEYDNTSLVSDHHHFPEPWPNFRNELEARLSPFPEAAIRRRKLHSYDDNEEIKPIFVSRAPRHKSNGQGHLETIRSPKLVENGYTITKTALTNIKYRNGDIEGYYNPESDRLLYTALCNRLSEYGGDAHKAFAVPFYKPTSDGKQGPLVKKIKIIDKSSLGVEINNGKGYANNGSMVRIDVFCKDKKYYFVPIYTADTIKTKLPNRAVTAGKNYENWEVIDDSFGFLFSLYPNDLVRFEHKSGVEVTLVNGDKKMLKEGFMYYCKASISTASISVISHDNSYIIPSLGVKTLISFEKWQIGYLGKMQKVNHEKRLAYDNRKRK